MWLLLPQNQFDFLLNSELTRILEKSSRHEPPPPKKKPLKLIGNLIWSPILFVILIYQFIYPSDKIAWFIFKAY